MSHRARLLHVLASAPVAALLAVTIAPSAHAQNSTARPTPYVVAVDAGHGGSPDNNHPDVPFDPGVIGPTGLLEKDVTLAVAQDVQTRLEAEGVAVVMTRVDDRYVDIGTRMQTAIDNRASLFVSIHMNSFPDPTTGGATVLYPADPSAPFAQVMSDTLGSQLRPLGIADDGILLKDDLWIHASMPAVTVEGAYLSNPREESLMKTATSRRALAAAIVAGIDRQAPEIPSIHRELVAWDAAHRQSATASGSGAAVALAQVAGHGLRNVLLFLLAMAGWWQRRVVVPAAARAVRLLWVLGEHAARSLLADTAELNRKRAARHRRHQRLNRGRRRSLLERSQSMAPRRQAAATGAVYHSVYDDLRL